MQGSRKSWVSTELPGCSRETANIFRHDTTLCQFNRCYLRLIVLGKPGDGRCSDGVGAGGTRQSKTANMMGTSHAPLKTCASYGLCGRSI